MPIGTLTCILHIGLPESISRYKHKAVTILKKRDCTKEEATILKAELQDTWQKELDHSQIEFFWQQDREFI